MSAWQKIETAPKDGSIVILGSSIPGLRTIVACWERGCWEWPMSNNRPVKIYFPTHWQPLPEPPND